MSNRRFPRAVPARGAQTTGPIPMVYLFVRERKNLINNIFIEKSGSSVYHGWGTSSKWSSFFLHETTYRAGYSPAPPRQLLRNQLEEIQAPGN
jgi:hypothetical protein